MPYTQLNDQDRYVISHMHMAGFKPTEIAAKLGRHRSTIGRELKRNRCPHCPYPHSPHYLFDTAQRLARERRDQANRRYKLDNLPVGQYVCAGLEQRWSPQQIVGRLHLDYADDASMDVTHETIYQWIYRRSALGDTLHLQLRRRQPRRRRRIPGKRSLRGQIPGRIGIEMRPAIVGHRARFGDWESDTVEGAKGRGLLATHLERRSRYLLVRKLDNKRADTFSRVSISALTTMPAKLRRTMTADNGKEFAAFARMESQLKLRVYFANPHAPWERGANENANGLLRDYFPKGIDMRRVSHHQVARAQTMLNNRPRKCLNYRTPLEVLNALPGVALRN